MTCVYDFKIKHLFFKLMHSFHLNNFVDENEEQPGKALLVSLTLVVNCWLLLDLISFFFNFILFLTALGLSLVVVCRGLLSIVVCRLFIAGASVVAEHGSFSSCGAHTGSVAPQHVGSSWARD